VSELVSALRSAAVTLPDDVTDGLGRACAAETDPRARSELSTIQSAVLAAREGRIPLCQDTGTPAFFVRAGEQSPHLALVRTAIPEAVRQATAEVPLRPNSVDPFTGRNPGDNLGRGLPRVEWERLQGFWGDCGESFDSWLAVNNLVRERGVNNDGMAV